MDKRVFQRIAYAGICSLIVISWPTMAQSPTGNNLSSTTEEVAKARTIVESNLDSLKAHRKFIYAMGLQNPDLIKQYEAWFRQFPKNSNIPLALGSVYYGRSMPEARQYLLRAVEIDPGKAAAWYMLSGDAALRGESDLSAEYVRKAALTNPSNAGYAYGALKSFENSPPDDYRKMVFDFVARFPKDERGAEAIYWLGVRAVDPKDKIFYYERLRSLFPPKEFKWSQSGMIGLADIYLQTDLVKASTLINEMGDAGDWALRRQLAKSLIRVNELEGFGKYDQASIELDGIRLPKFNYLEDYIVLRKAALKSNAGDSVGAYTSLAAKFSKSPTHILYDSLLYYGNKTGKDRQQIDGEIEEIRNQNATPAYPFDLGLYTQKGTLHLDSLKGRVVLLTFWFPGCVPCKEEFPHFQTVVDSFKGTSLVYIGVNVIPSQDEYVIPFIKNNNYSFIPLRGNIAFATEKYNAHGQPANFLIDKEGRIVYRDFRIDEKNRQTLVMMISSLLGKEILRR